MYYISEGFIGKVLKKNKMPTGAGKINAPTFAYYTLYNKLPIPSMSGREISHPTRYINEIPIDKEVPIKSIKLIMSIPKIETRSSCQGANDRHPTFLIMRLLDRDEKAAKKFVDKITKFKDINCKYNLGMDNLYRICITNSTWFGQPDFEDWWMSLPAKIKRSL